MRGDRISKCNEIDKMNDAHGSQSFVEDLILCFHLKVV